MYKSLTNFWNHINLVILISRSRVALYRFWITRMIFEQIALSPVSIITDLPNTKICWKENIHHLLHIHHDYLNSLERKFNFEVIKEGGGYGKRARSSVCRTYFAESGCYLIFSFNRSWDWIQISASCQICVNTAISRRVTFTLILLRWV